MAKRRNQPLTDKQIASAKNSLIVEKRSYAIVARDLGVSERTLRHYCGTKHNHNVKISRPSRRVLTEMKLHQAKLWISQGMSVPAIAKKLKVSASTIRYYVGNATNKSPKFLTAEEIKIAKHLLFDSRISYSVVASLFDISEPTLRYHCGTRTGQQTNRSKKTGTFTLHLCHTTKSAYICLPRSLHEAIEQTGFTTRLAVPSKPPITTPA